MLTLRKEHEFHEEGPFLGRGISLLEGGFFTLLIRIVNS